MLKLMILEGSQLPSHLSSYELDGSQGCNRENQQSCQINAFNDYEAIQCWVYEYQQSRLTFRAYQKEAERLLLWSIYERHKPLSSLTREDFNAYFEFLKNPSPKDKWCGSKGGRTHKRGDKGWRPFTGPLSASAIATAITIINSLMNYLLQAQYLKFNPLSLIRHKTTKFNREEVNLKVQMRILELDEWEMMLKTLHEMPEIPEKEKEEKERLVFIIKILFFLGLRIHELETHTWSAFQKINCDWWFLVKGKGGKLAKIPVNDELMDAVIRYRIYLNYSAYPRPDELTPIIFSKITEKSLTARYINKLLKKLAFKTAGKFDDKDKQTKLKKFSAHWLRHLSASMQDRAGIAFKHIRANHRHENDETTRRYVHTWDKERHEEMKKMTLNQNKDKSHV